MIGSPPGYLFVYRKSAPHLRFLETDPRSPEWAPECSDISKLRRCPFSPLDLLYPPLTYHVPHHKYSTSIRSRKIEHALVDIKCTLLLTITTDDRTALTSCRHPRTTISPSKLLVVRRLSNQKSYQPTQPSRFYWRARHRHSTTCLPVYHIDSPTR